MSHWKQLKFPSAVCHRCPDTKASVSTATIRNVQQSGRLRGRAPSPRSRRKPVRKDGFSLRSPTQHCPLSYTVRGRTTGSTDPGSRLECQDWVALRLLGAAAVPALRMVSRLTDSPAMPFLSIRGYRIDLRTHSTLS